MRMIHNTSFIVNHPLSIKYKKNTSFIIISFALLQNISDLMSARGNHAIAIVKDSEKHEQNRN